MQTGPTTSPTEHPARGCALCEAHAKATTTARAPVRSRTENLLPWALAIVVSGPYALLVEGAARWVAFGLCLGLVAGAYLVWRSRIVSERTAAQVLAASVHELSATADARVAMVIRQFEWAVNDVANLRDALKRAQDAKAKAESAAHRARRYAHQLERQIYEARLTIGEYSRALGPGEPAGDEAEAQPESQQPEVEGDDLVVPLVWRVFEENGLQWLRAESAGIPPSQIRVLNDSESVVAISSKSIESVEHKQVSIVMHIPDDVRLALEHQADQVRHFRFEALVDEVWCPVVMRDARATGKVRTQDKRGRVWRPADKDPALIA